MQNIQDIWTRIQETKKQQKEIMMMYKDTLENSHRHKELAEQIKELSTEKKQIEAQAKSDLGSQYDKLNTLKKDIEMDKEMLSDVALSALMKGETVVITDNDKNAYEPIFSVRFKKSNEINQRKE